MQIESLKRYRLFLIVLVYLAVAIYSIGFGISFEVGQRDLLYSVMIAFLLTQICMVDSRISGKALPPNSFWVVLMFYPIAVPMLIFRVHGFKGIGVLMIHIIAYLLVGIICMIAAQSVYATFFS
jgi:hypothetical protein